MMHPATERALDQLAQALKEAGRILESLPIPYPPTVHLMTERQAYAMGADDETIEEAKAGPVAMDDGSLLHVIDGVKADE